jgi:hypothetical protein
MRERGRRRKSTGESQNGDWEIERERSVTPYSDRDAEVPMTDEPGVMEVKKDV